MFIGREEELECLRKELRKDRKSAILLYGRRRVGKTRLIDEALKGIDDQVVIFHEFHKVTLLQNLTEFSSSIAEGLGYPMLPPFISLADAFSFIAAQGKRVIVVMDEYCDLTTYAKKGEVDSYMRTVVDRLPNTVSVVLMGSALKVMQSLLEEENPLFGRFTLSMRLKEFDYFDSSLFFPGLARRDQLAFHAVFGGSPHVLTLLEPGEGLRENIMNALINPQGAVRSYVEAVIEMEAGRTPHGITILSLIGNGKRRYSELEDVIGKDSKGVLAKELKELCSLDILDRRQPINNKDNKKIFYEIADPLLRFYFTYIQPHPSIQQSNPGAFFDTRIAGSLMDFISRRFEDECRQYFLRLISLGRRTDILDIGTYWYDDKYRPVNGEFDVALKVEGGYEVYGAEFISKPFSVKDAKVEERQVMMLGQSVLSWGVISTGGFESPGDYVQIGLDDLFFSRG